MPAINANFATYHFELEEQRELIANPASVGITRPVVRHVVYLSQYITHQYFWTVHCVLQEMISFKQYFISIRVKTCTCLPMNKNVNTIILHIKQAVWLIYSKICLWSPAKTSSESDL